VPARAETVAIGFAPPVGTPLRYHIEQRRPAGAAIATFTATRDLRFERATDGYTLFLTLRAIDCDMAGDVADQYRAALSPLIGIEHHFHVDAGGRITGLDNLDVVWVAVEKGLRAMVAGAAEGSVRRRTADNVLTLLSGQSAEGKFAVLAGEIRPMLLFANSAIDTDKPRGLETSAGSPLGRPVAVRGLLAMTQRSGDEATLTENLSGEGVVVDISYRLSLRSGLVRRQDRTLHVGERNLTEIRTLEAAEN
jgi:hypothetical protein